MDLSTQFANCHAFTAQRSTLDLLPPKQAAVYAFYDLFRFSEVQLADDVDSFKGRHAREMSFKKHGLPEFLHIQLRGNPISFKGEGRRLCDSLDAGGAKDVCGLLAFLSFMNEPLYVGKADNVKNRFSAHHDTGFIYKMKTDFKRMPEEFLFFAFYCEEKYIRVIESVLIQLINPPINVQTT
jgi:hypothetical protein